MRHSHFILGLLFLLPFASSANYPASFTLVVNFQQNTGEAIHAGESYFFYEYHAATFRSDSALVQNGQYVFRGELLYPTAIRFYGYSGKLSFNHMVFIDSGYQEITLRRLGSGIVVANRPKSNIEKDYQSFLKGVGITDMDKEMPLKSLHFYIRTNPTSYVGLFALINQTFDFGFKPETRAIASEFAPALQGTKGYQYFKSMYLVKKQLPALNLKSFEGEGIKLNMTGGDGEYTFIELWYTGCYACVLTMEDLKKRKKKGLLEKVRIISINTDMDSISKESIAIMRKLSAPWVNYWDLGAKEMGKYIDKLSLERGAQSVYPTNVLVDNKGYIIARDIDVSRMEDFISSSTDAKPNRLKQQ